MQADSFPSKPPRKPLRELSGEKNKGQQIQNTVVPACLCFSFHFHGGQAWPKVIKWEIPEINNS